MNKLSEAEEKRTLWIMGKPYHWELNEHGRYSLQPGPSEYEKIRWEVVQRMIEKGMNPDDITAEMIDEVVAKAESAAIMEAVRVETEE